MAKVRLTLEEKLQIEREKLLKQKLKVETMHRKAVQNQSKQIQEYKFRRGGLVHIAGLLWINPNVLLGALLKEVLPTVALGNAEKIAEWEAAGKSYHDLPEKGKEREEFREKNEAAIREILKTHQKLEDVNVR